MHIEPRSITSECMSHGVLCFRVPQLEAETKTEFSDMKELILGSEIAEMSSKLDQDTAHPMGLLSSVKAIMTRSVGFSRHHSARSKRAQEISDRCLAVERYVCACFIFERGVEVLVFLLCNH